MLRAVTPGTVAHQAPLSPGVSQARILEWVAISFSGGSAITGIKPRSPTLQAKYSPSKPPGKPDTLLLLLLSLLVVVLTLVFCYNHFLFNSVEYLIFVSIVRALGMV